MGLDDGPFSGGPIMSKLRAKSRRQEVMATSDEGSGEDRLIATYFRPIATHPGTLGLADDAAVIAPPAGCDLVLTTDGVIGGVHFFPDDPADAVARRALR